PGLSFSFDWNTVKMKMTQQRIYMSLFLRHVSGTHSTRDVNISSRTMQEFHGQMPLFQHELERWKKAACSVLITANGEARDEKVLAALQEYGMQVQLAEPVTLPVDQPVITTRKVQRGIEFPMERLAVVAENEFFTKKQPRVR